MRVTIEGFGEMTAGEFEIRPQYRAYTPGPYLMADYSVVHFDGCAYEKIAPDVVMISGAWHGPALPDREPLTVTMGKAAFRCFVDYQDDAFLILRGERAHATNGGGV